MTGALEAFKYNIHRVNEMRGLHSALIIQVTPAIDLSDLLRSLHVLAVSALDHYVHELVLAGMMETFDGLRAPTAAYSKFRLTMSSILGTMTMSEARSNIEADIRTQHSFLSFQRPDKIADAIRLFSDVDLWSSVETKLHQPKAKIKVQLQLIVDRRNKIAHEADVDPSFPTARWPINPEDVAFVCQFIEELAEAIDSSVCTK